MPPPSPSRPGDTWIPLALCVVGVALRLFFVTAVHPADAFISSDMAAYHRAGSHLTNGVFDPWDTLWPAGYTGFLWGLYELGGTAWHVGLIQAVLGGLCPGLAFGLARGLGARTGFALAAGLLVCLHVPAILYSGLVLTETNFAFFVMLGAWAFLRLLERAMQGEHSLGWALSSGLALGAATAVRANLLLALPALAALLWFAYRQPLKARLKQLLPWALATALLPAAAMAHQSRVVGHRAGISTNGGVNFYLNFAGVDSVQYRGADGVYVVRPLPNALKGGPVMFTEIPLYREAHFYRLGFAELRETPSQLWSAGANLVSFVGLGNQLYWPGWAPIDPYMLTHTRLFFCFAILPATLGLLLALRRRRREELWQLAVLWCPIGSAVVATYFFLGDLRLRVPFDGLLWVLAVLAVQRAIDEVRARGPLAPAVK